jgi:hypothetical protein
MPRVAKKAYAIVPAPIGAVPRHHILFLRSCACMKAMGRGESVEVVKTVPVVVMIARQPSLTAVLTWAC